MKLFQCQRCGQLIYFENTLCVSCGSGLGYLPERTALSALDPASGDSWQALADPGRQLRYCANFSRRACNWMVDAGAGYDYCIACRLNRTVPNLAGPGQLRAWLQLETAKHRLVYSLLRLGLPLTPKAEDDQFGLAFDFLSEYGISNGPVFTGHSDGVITINASEADPAERESRRSHLDEPYRTLLGHFRHEIGHYYWDRLVRNQPPLDGFRNLFGDERLDYGSALANHHSGGPPPEWHTRFVTAYASSHPWEDWAETWAHYLHMVDSLETAYGFGLAVTPKAKDRPDLEATPDFDPYRERDFQRMIDAWLPLTYAVNSLNRSMGQPDLYPFVLPPPAVDKLRFVHELVRRTNGSQRPSDAASSVENSNAMAPPRSSLPSIASRS